MQDENANWKQTREAMIYGMWIRETGCLAVNDDGLAIYFLVLY